MNRVGRLSTATKVALGSLAAVVLFIVASRLVGRATESADEFGSNGSSLSTAKDGTAAWRELLERFGVDTTDQRGDLADSFLDPSDTLVLIDASPIGDDAETVEEFVRGGGRLVTGPGIPGWLRPQLEPEPIERSPVPERTRAVLGGARRELDHASTIYFEEDGVDTLAIVRPLGAGRVVVLADTSPLQNSRLSNLDNAAHALDATTLNRRVVFAEGVHGFGRARGIKAIPSRWRAAIIGGLLGGLLTILAAGRRIGPPEQMARPLPPARRTYAEALGTILGRTRKPNAAMQPMQQHVRRWVASSAALPSDGSDDDLRNAATTLGFDDDEADALSGPIDSDSRVLALGRALSRTSQAHLYGSHHSALEQSSQQSLSQSPQSPQQEDINA